MRKILTGKAKEDFYKFLIKKYPLNEMEVEEWFLSLYNEFKNASITEWFDSVGICIDRDCINIEMVITDFRGINEEQTIIDCDHEESFQYWWEEAIKKANEIYNSK